MEISDPLSVPPTPPGRATHPLLAELHRRHPDVDLVVLPAESAGRPGDDDDAVAVPAALAARRLVRVAEQLQSLWEASTGEPASPVARWHYASEPGWVRASARIGLTSPDGFHVLVSLRHHLEERGWTLTRPPSAVERLVARLDELELSASYAEGSAALMVNLAAAPLCVGPEAARHLVRQVVPTGGER